MDQKSIGRYEIVGELGRGGMGIVYRAIDPTIRRTIALKTLRLDNQSAKPEEVLRRFKHEAQLAGGMSHPNIVTIYDAGDDGPVFYIAMEFIEGHTLHSILSEQRLPLDSILQVARQVCSALDYAHQRGVVHRDVKPANIMGASLGSLKIMDFGIAKSDLGLTITGQVLGTPAYMSPEQVMGRPLDGRSDLFSFAVMLYQMATGEMPFSGNTATTIIYKIANEQPVAPCDLDVTIHPGLSAVITKALSKNPDDRFQTGAELVKALENYKSQPTPQSRKAAASAADAPTVTILMQAETTRPMPASPGSPRVVQPAQKHSAQNKYPWFVFGALVLLGLLYAGIHRNAASPASPSTETVARPVNPPAVASTPPASAPAVEQTPVPEFAELRVTSNPPGADVTINGKSEKGWTTPFTAKKLKAANYEVAFAKDGYVAQTRTLKLSLGHTSHLNADLVISGGDLALNSDPPGAFIFLDGKKLNGQVTPAQVHVQAGQHSVMLRMPGFQEENTTVDIKDGENYPFSPTLEKIRRADAGQQFNTQPGNQDAQRLKQAMEAGKGVLAIFSDPAGASISINGRTLPKTTPFRWPVNPGVYQIVLTLDGYRPVQRQVTVQAGKPSRIQVKLFPN